MSRVETAFARFQRRILRALEAAGPLGLHERTLVALLSPREPHRAAGALAYLVRARLIFRGVDIFGDFARLTDRGRLALKVRDRNPAAAGARRPSRAATPAAAPAFFTNTPPRGTDGAAPSAR
ncbi:MAG TPA: hypothetical protein VNE82_24965 [Candidatus Binataceae bacterium]|nr:hypothetical protein [Candidatus Binataceae bacterium]HVB83188.1 hypothetical protein [Candidatus Binataceae bacterium]